MKKIEKWWVESKTWQHVLLGIALVLFLFLAVILAERVLNRGKILPGISARGVYLGGLTKDQAEQKLNAVSNGYLTSKVNYYVDGKAYEIIPQQIGVSFDNKVLVNDLYQIGRSGNIFSDVATQVSLPFTQEDLMQINIDKDLYALNMLQLNEKLAQPSANASYTTAGSEIAISPEKSGRQLDMGMAVLNLTRQLSDLKTSLQIPTYTTQPDITSANLQRQKDRIAKLIASPLKLTYGGKAWDISQNKIISWLGKNSQYIPAKPSLLTNAITINQSYNDLDINKSAVAGLLNTIAPEINVEAIDAQLNIDGGRATIFKQSRDGKTLNVESSAQAIINVLNQAAQKQVALAVDVKKANINDENIDSLGIKELIGEGVSYFPGSTWQRLQNIRVGTARYQGVLIKPGQLFSFGEYLGEVGPAQGYAESKVILDGRQEFQYGGGLCQVSSTMFRAALNAGLPIVQRTNHAFQVSYYTQPYGVPGVDATIYYPAVDLKFKNDTNKHILVQTELSGSTLVFRFYGTKEKQGQIRGPFFNFGSLDPNSPSQTTFYRDVIKDGQVIKTDTFNTYYKSALDFPTTN